MLINTYEEFSPCLALRQVIYTPISFHLHHSWQELKLTHFADEHPMCLTSYVIYPEGSSMWCSRIQIQAKAG